MKRRIMSLVVAAIGTTVALTAGAALARALT